MTVSIKKLEVEIEVEGQMVGKQPVTGTICLRSVLGSTPTVDSTVPVPWMRPLLIRALEEALSEAIHHGLNKE